MRLGRILVEMRAISGEQLDAALAAQVVHGGRLGTNLLEMGYIDLETLTAALSRQYDVPGALPAHFEQINPATARLFTPQTAQKIRGIPLGGISTSGERQVLGVAFVDPSNLLALDEVAFVTGYQIRCFVAAELCIEMYLERLYSIPRPERRNRSDSTLSTRAAHPDRPPQAQPHTASHRSAQRTRPPLKSQPAANPYRQPVDPAVAVMQQAVRAQKRGPARTMAPMPHQSPSGYGDEIRAFDIPERPAKTPPTEHSHSQWAPAQTPTSRDQVLQPGNSRHYDVVQPVTRPPSFDLIGGAGIDLEVDMDFEREAVVQHNQGSTRAVGNGHPGGSQPASIAQHGAPAPPTAAQHVAPRPGAQLRAIPGGRSPASQAVPIVARQPASPVHPTIPPIVIPQAELPAETAEAVPANSAPTAAKAERASRPSSGPAVDTANRPALSLDDALGKLTTADSRDDIGDAIADYLRSTFECGLVLIARDELLLGWKGFSSANPNAMVEAIALPLGTPSMFALAYGRKTLFRGAAPQTGAAVQERFWKMLGCDAPSEVLIAPICIGKRVVNLVYAHAIGGGALPSVAATEMTKLSAAAAAAFIKTIKKANKA